MPFGDQKRVPLQEQPLQYYAMVAYKIVAKIDARMHVLVKADEILKLWTTI